MKKYLIHIGPDTVAVKAKSKKHVRRRLAYSLANGKKTRNKRFVGESLDYIFKGRVYMKSELQEACILSLNEYWKAMSCY